MILANVTFTDNELTLVAVVVGSMASALAFLFRTLLMWRDDHIRDLKFQRSQLVHALLANDLGDLLTGIVPPHAIPRRPYPPPRPAGDPPPSQ